MAGGGGTRFWPLSRKNTPKQLLNLSGREIMVNEAIDRLSQIAENKNIYIVTNAAQKEAMLNAVCKRVEKENILAEPAARNTAACIGYAACEIIKKHGDGIMVITPSDAYIKDSEEFAKILRIAVNAAEDTNKLITVGITPTFPATGYGYINYKAAQTPYKPVIKFVEKPNAETAEKYLQSGDFVWNSGMFIWRASTILEKFKAHLPEVYGYLLKIKDALGTENESEEIQKLYPQIPSVSIDYGIMEKCSDILVVPGEFGWNDVGSWDMFNVLHKEDKDGNILIGDCFAEDTKNTTVYSSGKFVATLGVENLVIVETPDAVMVCTKEKAQEVKKIVDRLKAEHREELL